jgi:hypothetical protein
MRELSLETGYVTLIYAALGLSACTTPDKVALHKYAPKSGTGAIEAVSLSPSEHDAFEPKRVGTELSDSTAQVAVWYRWAHADSGLRVGIRWSKSGEVVLQQEDTLREVAGASAYVMKLSGGSALPTGEYDVQLLENGVPVTHIPFKVGGAAPEPKPILSASVTSAAASTTAPREITGLDSAATDSTTDPSRAEQPGVAESGATVLAGEETKWPGVTAEVIEFQRKGKTLTAKVRFTNRGSAEVRPSFYYSEAYLLDADNTKTEVLKDEDGHYLAALTSGYSNWWGEFLKPGTSQTVWIRFSAPPSGLSAMTLQIPGMEPFEDLPISD